MRVYGRSRTVLDAEGNVALPPGITLISLIERNIANVGDSVAYRYLDHTRSADGYAFELTWTQLGRRMRAIGARVQRVASRGDRVAILAPQGLDYVAGFFAAIKAGTIAVPAVRPGVARSCRASRGGAARFTTHRCADDVGGIGRRRRGAEPRSALAPRPHVITIDDVPDSAGDGLGCRSPRRRRHLPSAVHLGIDAGSGRRGDHPPRGRHQPDADDSVDRPPRPKHPRLQLVTALPRHGSVDDRLSHGLRRPLDADVAGRLHPAARALDPRIGGTAPGTAASSPPRPTSRASTPHSAACPRQGRAST